MAHASGTHQEAPQPNVLMTHRNGRWQLELYLSPAIISQYFSTDATTRRNAREVVRQSFQYHCKKHFGEYEIILPFRHEDIVFSRL
jgi:hypothetical protein